MGTRCLTVVKDGGKDAQDIICLYRQFDGYPDGHGAKLHELFGDFVIVNGLGGQSPNVANGMGCLAAQLVAKLKLDQYESDQERRKQMAEHYEARAKDDPDAAIGNVYLERTDGMAGGFYLYPTGTEDVWEEYKYTLYMDTSCQERIEQEFAELAKECEKSGDYGPLHDKVRPAGEIYLMVECPVYDAQYKHDGWAIMYDGPLKDFAPEACVDPNAEEGEEDDA